MKKEKVRFPSPCGNIEEEEKLLTDIWGLNYKDESAPEKTVYGISQTQGQEIFEVLVNEGGSPAVVEVLRQFVDQGEIEVIKEKEELDTDDSKMSEQENEGGVEASDYAVLKPSERKKFIEIIKNKIPNLMDVSWVRRTGRLRYVSPEDQREIIGEALKLALEEYDQDES